MTATIEFDDFLDTRTENDTPSGSAKIITKEPSTTAQYTNKEDITASSNVEGTSVLSTGETGATKFLREDGDNSSSWQSIPAQEGTAILSTGETGGTKYLREDGDGTCSWQPVAGGSSDRGITISLGGNAYTKTGIIKVRANYAMTLSKVRLGVFTPSTGSAITVDVNYHATDPTSATSIFSSLPSISATAYTGESTSLSTTSIAAGGWLVIDIDAVGSTTPGTDLVIEILE